MKISYKLECANIIMTFVSLLYCRIDKEFAPFTAWYLGLMLIIKCLQMMSIKANQELKEKLQ